MGFVNAQLFMARERAEALHDDEAVARLTKEIERTQAECAHERKRMRRKFDAKGATHRTLTCIDCSAIFSEGRTKNREAASAAPLPPGSSAEQPAETPKAAESVQSLAQELVDEDQCSLDWRHWKREELVNYCRRAARLAEMILNES